MKVEVVTNKQSFLNMLLQVINKVDIQKGTLDKVDCQKYTIEYTLPEGKPAGSLDQKLNSLWISCEQKRLIDKDQNARDAYNCIMSSMQSVSASETRSL